MKKFELTEEKIATNAADLYNKLAPLYYRYPMQLAYQPAYIELNPSERSLGADYNVEVGNAVPSAVWHNCIYRLPIPATLRGSAVAALLRDPEVLHLAEVVCEGHSVEWDGNNQRGYLTEDGLEALEALEYELAEDRFSEADHVEVWDVGDWLSTWTPTLGETLEEAAETIEQEAEGDGILIVGDVLEWLQENHPDAE
ncbi:MAG: hypothetical protein DDT40_01534 [candidate division WS2 bacterium]|nr:hypothetical protein [Candidatus Psychracetigena formicireducens]